MWNGKSRLTRKRPFHDRAHEPDPNIAPHSCPHLPSPLPSAPCAPLCSHDKGEVSMDHTGMTWWPVAVSHPTNPLIFMSACWEISYQPFCQGAQKRPKPQQAQVGDKEGEGINQIPVGNQDRNVIQAGAKGLLGFFVVWVFSPYLFPMQ